MEPQALLLSRLSPIVEMNVGPRLAFVGEVREWVFHETTQALVFQPTRGHFVGNCSLKPLHLSSTLEMALYSLFRRIADGLRIQSSWDLRDCPSPNSGVCEEGSAAGA